MRIFFITLVLLSFGGCSLFETGKGIDPKPAPTVPPDTTFEKFKVETLSDETLKELGAVKDDLIIVIKENGKSIMYGAPGKAFRKGEPGELEKHLTKLKKAGVKPNKVNNFQIKTYVNSPGCNWIDDGRGNIIWYPAGCP